MEKRRVGESKRRSSCIPHALLVPKRLAASSSPLPLLHWTVRAQMQTIYHQTKETDRGREKEEEERGTT